MAQNKTVTRRLGQDGPSIPAVGFGLMGLSVGYGAIPSDEERLALLSHAHAIGATNWDTADCYADSEQLVGKWFTQNPSLRKDIFLASKFALRPAGPGEEETLAGLLEDSSPEYAKKAVESSLAKLGVETIDLYYVHRVQPNVPIEKTMRAMKELKDQGKIKHIGLCEASGDTIRRAHAITPVAAVQAEYNPWSLEIEGSPSKDVKSVCEELGISIFCYAPLGRGIITGQYRSPSDFPPEDLRSYMSRYQGENFANNLKVVDKFSELAHKKGCTTGQLVLAWVLMQSENIFVIPGTKKVKYLEENMKADNVHLTKEDEAELREIVAKGNVDPDRAAFFGTYVDTVKDDGQ